jgi:sugar-specific transcriptional regulator TrmB
LTADLEAEKNMKDLIEKQKNRLKQKVDELETRLKTEADARDEMEAEARKAKLDLRRMERELKAAIEDRDLVVRVPLVFASTSTLPPPHIYIYIFCITGRLA